MGDRDAALHEALAKFEKICKKYDASMVCRIILNNKKFCGAQTYSANKEQDLEFIYELLNDYVRGNSNNNVRMVKVVD